MGTKTEKMLEIERERGQALETLLPYLLNQEGSIEKAADALGVNPNTIKGWVLRLGIRFRTVWEIEG